MLAEFYAREAAVTSRVFLVSAVISILTVSAYLAVSAQQQSPKLVPRASA